jgi:hypothetical protein
MMHTEIVKCGGPDDDTYTITDARYQSLTKKPILVGAIHPRKEKNRSELPGEPRHRSADKHQQGNGFLAHTAKILWILAVWPGVTVLDRFDALLSPSSSS